MKLQLTKPTLTRNDQIGIWIFVIGALWLEIMFLPFFASNMPLLDMSKPLPEATPLPNITIVFNFTPNVTINNTVNGIDGTVDPTIPTLIMIIGTTYALLKRYSSFKKNSQANKQ